MGAKTGPKPKPAGSKNISRPLSFHPSQIFWIKKNAIRYGLPDSRFLQALVDRAMQDPIFVQAGVLGYCIEEYAGLVPPKPIAHEMVECILALRKQLVSRTSDALQITDRDVAFLLESSNQLLTKLQ